MSHDGIDHGEHPDLVVEKTNRNREDLTAAISQRWSWQNLATIHSSTPEVQFLQDWKQQARNFTRYAFNKIGLASSQSSNQILAYNEWEYIKGYFEGIKNASGAGKQYELPSELPFIGGANNEFEGVKRYSTFMIRVRLFHISHLILRGSDFNIPEIGLQGGPRAILEHYVHVEVGSDLARKIDSVFAAIKRLHHKLGIQYQRELEVGMVQLEMAFEHASSHDLSFQRFEKIIQGNENYAEWLAHKHAQTRLAHHLRTDHPEPTIPVPYLPILGEILHKHTQHLAEEATNPPGTPQHSLARSSTSRLSHRRRAIYNNI